MSESKVMAIWSVKSALQRHLVVKFQNQYLSFNQHKIHYLNPIFHCIWRTKNFNSQPTQFLKKKLKNYWSQTMLLAILVILTYPRRNYLEVFFSYLLFQFKIALWRHQVIFVHLIITKKDAPWFKNFENEKLMRFVSRNQKFCQFEDLKLLSSATWWSKFETNTLFIISFEFSTRILNFTVFGQEKNFNFQPTQFLSQTMLLAILDILTPL